MVQQGNGSGSEGNLGAPDTWFEPLPVESSEDFRIVPAWCLWDMLLHWDLPPWLWGGELARAPGWTGPTRCLTRRFRQTNVTWIQSLCTLRWR